MSINHRTKNLDLAKNLEAGTDSAGYAIDKR